MVFAVASLSAVDSDRWAPKTPNQPFTDPASAKRCPPTDLLFASRSDLRSKPESESESLRPRPGKLDSEGLSAELVTS